MALSGECGSRIAISLLSHNGASRTGSYIASVSDHRLVFAARSDCCTAFEDLWNLYSRRVYKTVFKITKNREDAEDALQDSFFRAFISLESFEGRSSFYSWLTRIAINSALGTLRKRRRHPETSLNPTSQQEDDSAPEEIRDLAPDPEQIYDRHQRRTRLMQAMHGLPTVLREAVQVRIREDCSLREVAYRLNISEAAAKARFYRARTRLGLSTVVRRGQKSQTAPSGRSEAFSR